MHRKQLILLEKWISNPSRKPLILRGARQVGKSTLIQLFAKRKNLRLQEANLERFPDLKATFQQSNPVEILAVLDGLVKKTTSDGQELLFLDEIQAIPEAIPSLRYFYEDLPDKAVVAAGSLLEFVLSQHNFSMPVGRVEYLHMGPMCFSEFLLAIGEDSLCETIQGFDINKTLAPAIHNRLLALLRVFFVVGGMPDAVASYALDQNFENVSNIHRSIIDTYREDFPKYSGRRSIARMQHVFNFSARNVGKKVKYSHYSRDDAGKTIKADIELLTMARVVNKVIHSHCNGLPIQAELADSIYKLIFLDVGLMNACCGLGFSEISRMNETSLVNEGTIAEQFIGQHLQETIATSSNRQLCYWLREGKQNNAELDYVISLHGSIIPIGVKAGASGRLKSLTQFMSEKTAPFAVRFDTNPASVQDVEMKLTNGNTPKTTNYRLVSLPLYLVEQLPQISAQILGY